MAKSNASLSENITEIEKVARSMMNVNFHGAVYTAYYALPHLKKSGGQIVAVSSIAGEIAPPFLTFYAAAKHAMHGKTTSFPSQCLHPLTFSLEVFSNLFKTRRLG